MEQSIALFTDNSIMASKQGGEIYWDFVPRGKINTEVAEQQDTEAWNRK